MYHSQVSIIGFLGQCLSSKCMATSKDDSDPPNSGAPASFLVEVAVDVFLEFSHRIALRVVFAADGTDGSIVRVNVAQDLPLGDVIREDVGADGARPLRLPRCILVSRHETDAANSSVTS